MFWEMADAKPTPRLQQQIDQNLRRVYEEALKEEVPDRFKVLMERLRQKEGKT